MHPRNASEGHDGQLGSAHSVTDTRLFERRMQNSYNDTTSEDLARGVIDYFQNALRIIQHTVLGHPLENAVMQH